MMFVAVMLAVAVMLTVAAMVAMVAMAAIVIAVGIMTVLGFPASASVVAATAFTMEAMFAPAVCIAPAGPGAYAEENAIVEVPRPVKSIGRASVGRSFVIAPLTDGWDADFDGNLSFCSRHNGQSRKQYCRSEQSFESSHM